MKRLWTSLCALALILICIVLLPTTAEAATYSGKSDPKPYTVEFRNWDGKLISSNIEKRNEVLAMLSEASVIHTGVTARADDQVLLLVTCVGEDTERRAIAARRLREGETEADIAALVR